MAEPTVENPLVITTTIQLTSPHLAALALAVGAGLPMYEALVLQALALRWLGKLREENGTYLCPICTLMWSSREKRDACQHVNQRGWPLELPGKRVQDTLAHWNGMIDDGNYPNDPS